LFEDLLKSDEGAFRCLALRIAPTDTSLKHYDYPLCDKENPEECIIFLENPKLESKVLSH